MKYKFQGEPLNSKVTTYWKEISNTNIRHIDIDEFKERVEINPTMKNERHIRSSGLAKATSFPPALVSLKLVMACREAYQEETRTIVERDGNILASLSTKLIGRYFHIPIFREMEEASMEYGKKMWDEDPLKCKKVINQYWLKEKRGGTTKVPQELFRSHFYEDYHDLVLLLSKVMGLLISAYFQEWMFYFVEEIIHGKTKFYWVGIIRNCLHEQFVAIKKTSRFYMTSYLIYLLVDKMQYRHLFKAPDEAPGRELKIDTLSFNT